MDQSNQPELPPRNPLSSPPRLRAFLLALGVVAGLAAITPYNDYDLENTFIAGNLLPVGSVVVLLLLVGLVNPLLHWLAPRQQFRRSELALIWGLIVLASGIPAAGLWRYLIPVAITPYYAATSENHWDTRLASQVPYWLIPQDKEAARQFFEGLPPGGHLPWRPWLVPLVMWLALVLAMFWCIVCLTTILRRQWVDHERFTFPLVQLPFELTQPPRQGKGLTDLLRNPMVWAGASIPILIHSLDALHLYFPPVPALNLHFFLWPYFSTSPWNTIADSEIHIYFSIIGLTYLLAQDVALSFGAFYLIERVQQLFLARYALVSTGNDAASIVLFQAYGAALALVGSGLVLARTHLIRVVRTAWRPGWPGEPDRTYDDREEPLSYRVAVIGLILGTGFVYFFLRQAGIQPVMALSLVGGGYTVFLSITWMATNGGLLMTQIRWQPGDLVWAAWGTRDLLPSTVVVTPLVERVFWFDPREALMPSLMNVFKLADLAQIRRSTFLATGMVAVLLAVGVSLVAWMKLCYFRGGAQLSPGTFLWHARWPWQTSALRLDPGQDPVPLNLVAAGLGAGLYLVLSFLRLRFVGWPLHPVGMIIYRSWASQHFWFSTLLAWGAKALIVRYGGLKLFNRLRPFFLGLILGDLLIAGVLTVVGLFTGQGYSVLPL